MLLPYLQVKVIPHTGGLPPQNSPAPQDKLTLFIQLFFPKKTWARSGPCGSQGVVLPAQQCGWSVLGLGWGALWVRWHQVGARPRIRLGSVLVLAWSTPLLG